MESIDISSVLDEVLRNDIEPPSDGYSAYDFGLEVAKFLDSDSAGSLIYRSLADLPSTLAESFVEGILSRIGASHLEETLLAVLPHVREVSSAGLVANLICRYPAAISPVEFLSRSLDLMFECQTEECQNKCAYAVYSIFGRVTTKSHDEKSPVNSARDVLRPLVEAAAANPRLTSYSRQILERVRSALN